MKKIFGIIFLIICTSALFSIAPANAEPFKFYGKGHVDPSHPVFGNEFLRTVIKDDKGVLINIVPHFGMVLIRMDLQKNETCDTNPMIICFTGTISELKNVDHPNVGSEITLKINLIEGIEDLSILTGNMAGTEVRVFLENIGDKMNNEYDKLQISWDTCEVEFDEENFPKSVKITPKVINKLQDPINETVDSKFRFSVDSEVHSSSHIHLDNIFVDDFKIIPKDNSSIFLNVTKALLDAEKQNISLVEIKSRHYTLMSSDVTAYDNDDHAVIVFKIHNQAWVIDGGVCESISEIHS